MAAAASSALPAHSLWMLAMQGGDEEEEEEDDDDLEDTEAQEAGGSTGGGPAAPAAAPVAEEVRAPATGAKATLPQAGPSASRARSPSPPPPRSSASPPAASPVPPLAKGPQAASLAKTPTPPPARSPASQRRADDTPPKGALPQGDSSPSRLPAHAIDTQAMTPEPVAVSLVEVRLRHKIDGTEVHVEVPATATMRDVRAAAARKLNNDLVLTDGRLVNPGKGTVLTSYPDKEQLGHRRRLLFLGVSLGMRPAQSTSLWRADSGAVVPEPATAEVEVRLKHKVDGTELVVMVPETATMRDVRQAAADKLHNNNILKEGRIVKKQGELLTVYMDNELLGVRRRLLFVGADLRSREGTAPLLMEAKDPPRADPDVALPALPAPDLLPPRGASTAKAASAAAAAASESAAEAGADEQDVEPAKADRPVREVDVVVKHAITDEEFTVRVPYTATIKDVKEAAAAKLGLPVILEKGRLVRKSGATYASLRDAERLGSRRRLLMMGVASFKAPSVEKKVPILTRFQALSMQLELYEGFRDTEFQRRLKDLEGRLDKKSPDYRRERSKLILEVQGDVFPKYGFEGSIRGAVDVVQQLSLISILDAEVAQLGAAIDQLIGTEQGQTQTSSADLAPAEKAAEGGVATTEATAEAAKVPEVPPEEAKPPVPAAEEVSVTVKHAVHGDDVTVKVMSNATLRQVKEAMAEKLGKPQLAKKGRIVRSQGQTFTSIMDDAPLGTKRKFLFMGPSLLPDEQPLDVAEASLSDGHNPEGNYSDEGIAPAEKKAILEQPATAHVEEAAAGAAPRDVNPVEITVRHAVEDGQVTVHATSSMTMREVKVLLAEQLGQMQIAKEVKFIRKLKKGRQEGITVSINDGEKLGSKFKKRTIQCLNVSLPKPDGAASAASAGRGAWAAASAASSRQQADDQNKTFFVGMPIELKDHERKSEIAIWGLEDRSITVREMKRELKKLPPVERPMPEEYTVFVMEKGKGGQMTALKDSDCPAEVTQGPPFVLLFEGFTPKMCSTWVTVPFATRTRAMEAMGSFAKAKPLSPRARVPEPRAKGTAPRVPAAPPRPVKDRMIHVELQYSKEQAFVLVKGSATVRDLRRQLDEEYGVPQNTTILGRLKEGFAVPLEDSMKPKRSIILKGVMTLTQRVKVTEADVTKVVEDLNKKYEKAEFQELVAHWKQGGEEAAARLASFRSAAKAVTDEVLPKYGFEASKEGTALWQQLVKGFLRFPAFAEIWRKGQILLGTMTPEEAAHLQWLYMKGRERDDHQQAPKRDRNSRHGHLLVREILSGAALVREKKDADDVLDLLYRRIYEENRQELWEGGNVRGHKMPTRRTVARKYLEPPGTVLLHCSGMSVPVVGGAVLFPVQVDILNINGFSVNGETEEALFVHEEEEEEEDDDEDDGVPPHMRHDDDEDDAVQLSVGYIDALAATGSAHAGSAMLQHIEAMAMAEGWQMLVLHSIRIEKTMRFWERKGFQHYSAQKDAAFRLACLQNCGFAVPIRGLERQLPPRPGCLLFAKFVATL